MNREEVLYWQLGVQAAAHTQFDSITAKWHTCQSSETYEMKGITEEAGIQKMQS